MSQTIKQRLNLNKKLPRQYNSNGKEIECNYDTEDLH